MEPLIIFSGDGHVGPQPEQIAEYLDPQYRDYIAELEQECKEFSKFAHPSIERLTPEQMAIVDDDQAISSLR